MSTKKPAPSPPQETQSKAEESSEATKPQWSLDSKKTPEQCVFFWKVEQPYGYFCQWYPSRFIDHKTGMIFNCAEQWMMYHKAMTFSDKITAAAVMKSQHPADQKALGRQTNGFKDEVWDKIKYDVVVRGNMLKFTQCKARDDDDFVYPPDGRGKGQDAVSLLQLLRATGKATLAEASPSDRVWGIGLNAATAEKQGREQWGQNLLGKALMEVRNELSK
ncbi:MAG: hypothetical protein Q9159_003446 [Coniocarpon cinnabarinum]